MPKLIKSLFAIGILISISLTIFVPAAEAANKRVKGVIRDVNLLEDTVTIAVRNDAGETALTLNTDNQTVITLNGQPATLEDLQQGQKVKAVYDDATFLASSVEARGKVDSDFARVEGKIADVNTEERTVTIDPIREDAPRVTLKVTDSTEIILENHPARLEDLVPGYSAAAAYKKSTLEALRIHAESLAEIRGVIRDVNAVSGTLTIHSSGGRIVTLNVPPGTPISLNDRPATLEDLARGYLVKASYNAVTLEAHRIAAQSLAEVVGHIREVDLHAKTVTIVPLVDGEAVELFVVNSTEITINGEPARFEDLRQGMPARAVFNIASLEAHSIAARRENDECNLHRVRSKIARVNPDAGTVTIETGDGIEPLTLNVTPDTKITINERPARLSDLQPGMRARAEFCRERLVATAIAASAPDSTAR